MNIRKLRGVGPLCEYLESINCPMSESTIYRLMRTKKIPFTKPSARVILFDLNEIDKWLGGDHP